MNSDNISINFIQDVAVAVITTENSTLYNIAKKCSELPKALKINSKQVRF